MLGLVAGLFITASSIVSLPLADLMYRNIDEIYIPFNYWQYRAEAEEIRSRLETVLPLMKESTLKDLVKKELYSD